MTITKPPDPDQEKASASALAAVQLRKAQLAHAEALTPKPLFPEWGEAARARRARAAYEAARPKTRQRNARNQRAHRERKRVEMEIEGASTLAALDHLKMPAPVSVARQILLVEARAFREWLDLGGPQQRQYRPQKASYMTSRVVLLHARLELDGDPAPADFAARLTKALAIPVDRMQARNRLVRLLKLEGPGGPWFPGAGSV